MKTSSDIKVSDHLLGLLKEMEDRYQDFIHLNANLNRQLVSSQANKNAPFYRWYRYQEGFSSKLVNHLITDSGITNGVLLDPFAGLGTTLFCARERGLDSIGIELLPVGPFVFKARLLAEQMDVEVLKGLLRQIKDLNFAEMPISEETNFKHVRITDKAFSPETERKINAFRFYIKNVITDPALQEILKFVCLSILEKVSYTEKAGQFLRWDTRSGKPKAEYTKNKILDFEKALYTQIACMIEDLQSFYSVHNKGKLNSMELKHGSNFQILPTIPDGSIDLIITSPPYLNRYDYTRVYALELAFLGVDESALSALRQNLLSCTVENKEKLDFIKNIYVQNNKMEIFNKALNTFQNNEVLKAIISHFEDLKAKKQLNNPNVLRLIYNYFLEHAFIMFELARVLKTSGKIYYVNDNVRFAGVVIPVDLILTEFALKAGLRLKKIDKLPTGKGNSSQQMGAFGKEEVRKCIYLWEK
ncbi:MAG: DNA methyltransferase [Candidatus Sigynarchaeota archaeon]